MRKFADLHLHSTYSEGDHTVDELLQLASHEQIAALSLTDHNVIAGNVEMLKKSKKYGVTSIPGVELYTTHAGQELHLLGYNFSLDNKGLLAAIKALQEDNRKNVINSVKELTKMGFVINERAIFMNSALNFGAVQILKELEQNPDNIKKIERELKSESHNFFKKISYYFGRESKAYFPTSTLPTKQAIKLLRNAGGFTALAHPGQQLSYNSDKIIIELASQGLQGLEILSPYHTWHQIEHYQALAAKYGLLITGGSDYHGDLSHPSAGFIKRQWDYFKVPFSIYLNLEKNLITSERVNL